MTLGIDRRHLLAGLLAAPVASRLRAAEADKRYRVAVVATNSPVSEISETSTIPAFPAFLTGLRRLGYVEGKNLTVLRFSAAGNPDRYETVISQAVAEAPDLILSPGLRFALGFKTATKTIPIIAVVSDPLTSGVVSNVARPGGNITGISLDAGLEIWGKRIAFLREIAPTASRVAVVATEALWQGSVGEAIREGLRQNSMTHVGSLLRGPFEPSEYEAVFGTFEQAQAILVDSSPENFVQRKLIVDLIAKRRSPAIYGFRDFVDVGGLMSYGVDFAELYRHAADYANLILNGTPAGDIPIFQGTKFHLVVNLRTAKASGVTLPATILAQADDVVE
ncbi:ABC transporter substrate-binding protein [Bradyrhizobium sp. CCBAU 51627]|uniref:ABC transporter substrate-binding protein n=1 Tax=Bradyrhizobium sp. CCBAU 51627 TaxID=1325088 RepID=UPI002306D052|nr:ABC transporter substrate-binding protein [Bradyrhizobium sp. CCBAU 51627]MDA9430603.1 hypothetical protein [Bradyrhizobium sp. CCBAU 51627]